MEPCGGVLRSSARPPQGSCGGLAEVVRRSCGGPCGGLAEFIEILRRPPQEFEFLHYVVIGPHFCLYKTTSTVYIVTLIDKTFLWFLKNLKFSFEIEFPLLRASVL